MNKYHFREFMAKNKYIAISILILVLGIIGVLIYSTIQVFSLSDQLKDLANKTASTTEELSQNIRTLVQNISDLQSKSDSLSNNLSNTNNNISAVKNEVGSISGTVGTLKKLSETDPEFLVKYSKIYFLNENYMPAHLNVIPDEFLYSDKRSEQFLSEAWPKLKILLDDAKSAGITLYVKSAYRSFDEQKALKSTYSVIYGSGTANQFSADQGYSEHQLGTTIDFITTGLNGQLDGFENTKAYEWLLKNAYRYGFELSYPENNKYYVFEPWHWRFVGVKLATYLYQNKKNFYDMDQRDIDIYLADIFD
ncbi:MAG: M15 family metallopeptidase [Candidatus Paceibacterota bacterium]